MKKTFLAILSVAILTLCVCLAGCFLFKPDNPDNPDNPDGDKAVDLSTLTISISEASYVYDGKPHTPDVTLYRDKETLATLKNEQTHPDLTVEYRDNVEIGKATVTVTAKSGSKKFSGSIQTDFDVKPIGTISVSDFATLKAVLNSGVYSTVRLSNDVEIPQGERVEVSAITTLVVYELNLINRGELVNKGTIEIGSNYSGVGDLYDLTNYGKFVNDEGGRLVFKNRANVVNHGQFESVGDIRKSENNFQDNYIYTDSDLDFTVGFNIKIRLRNSVLSDAYSLEADKIPYNGSPIEIKLVKTDPNGTAVAVDAKEYSVAYSRENVSVGKITATVTADEHSSKLFGTRAFEFEITRAHLQTADKQTFLDALANANYGEITYTADNYIYVSELNVLPNVTVNMRNWNADKITLGSNAVLNVYDGDIGGVSTDSVANFNDNVINVYGKTLVYVNLTGSATINVKPQAELYFASNVAKPDVTINNEGGVYADFDLSFVSGRGEKIVRRQLTVDQIAVTNPEYTGKAISLKEKLSFEHSDIDRYNVDCFSADGQNAVYPLIERGDYLAELRFYDDNKYYTGNLRLNISVVKGKITVKDTAELQIAIKTDNYDRYLIETWTNRDAITIPFGNTVIADTVTNYGEITVRGALEITGGFTNGNVFYQSGSTVTVDEGATIRLNGDFYNCDENSILTLNPGATFENNGAVYLCDKDISEINGDKYVRVGLSANAQFVNVEQAVYGVDTEPDFDLRHGEVQLDLTRFTVAYSNCSWRTDGDKAVIKVTAKMDDRDYYGATTHNYAILGGKTYVSTDDELYSALNNLTWDKSLCNWAEIEITAKIELSANVAKGKPVFHVYRGTTLVVKYEIAYWANAYSKDDFDFANNGVINIYNGVKFDDVDVWKKNGSGYVNLFASAYKDFNSNQYALYDNITLTKDILWGYDDLYISATARGTTLNLNGFSLELRNHTLYLRATNGDLTIINGAINVSVYASVNVDGNAGNHVYLQNVTVEGTIADPKSLLVLQ